MDDVPKHAGNHPLTESHTFRTWVMVGVIPIATPNLSKDQILTLLTMNDDSKGPLHVDPLRPREIQSLFSSAGFRWRIAGGWALV
jgi:hypothetical protein